MLESFNWNLKQRTFPTLTSLLVCTIRLIRQLLDMSRYFMVRACTSNKENLRARPLFFAMCIKRIKEGVVPTCANTCAPQSFDFLHNSLQQLQACGSSIPLPHHQAFPRAWAGGGPETLPNPLAQTCSRDRVDSPQPPIVSRQHSRWRPVASVCPAVARF